jgi:hypothetical protein
MRLSQSRSPMTSARRLARMRDLFETKRAVLAEDYEHFTQPQSPAPIPDAPTRPNKAARRSEKPSARRDQERS